jgi:glycerophosphoryl diester phosphodiesterase
MGNPISSANRHAWAYGEHRPQVISHRGCAGLAPENTLSSIRKALELKVDGIELDVQLTKDGQVVVHHDRALDPNRTKNKDGEWITDNSLFIDKVDLEELLYYTVGEIKPGLNTYPFLQQTSGETIPTLKEVFKQVKNSTSRSLEFFIELKIFSCLSEDTSKLEAFIHATLKEIKKADFIECTHILSFNHKVLTLARYLYPNIRIAYLFEPNSLSYSIEAESVNSACSHARLAKYVRQAGGTCFSPPFKDDKGRYITKEQVKMIQKEGLECRVWTPNYPRDLKKMIKLGVDGIITDRPDILINLLKDPRHDSGENQETCKNI